ncbi:AbrB/MazE/SpoVT family DNA-binding domain-containing protein [Cupriavidus taiwanensis]|uniref:PemI-like protein antitoxin of a toxin-antitoxin system n=1 Tax=Cupriavidus taiwanensis TaxID=164546 RepID=A0A375H000_9BURK|nr:AbrB/MazE/SpoVT family DNA-binding domain-containing protein [Cupriavidus taiwanensis]SOY43149.1 PemI-like protein; antitoxin of a toxin-antitoxin system [Cupriavidus taiwanensis]SOY45631.1 PemI-like protein; antitoxin of a toxin-antitoxin system [Cupriavidus taiwanensis]SOY81076.1 PemI-like protein; antitoxin of a toxin-antitoxin system [Cupriavidus taiwanensis]SOZ21919.1 PemI-like protein; antitoxin of a toxin-antitoxin system [Cupriavidus taiwanensis]SOZ53335.1 PemI-like protein; antitox
MKATIRKMGNSQGVLIPKAILAQLGLENEVEMEIVNDTLVLRRPRQAPRQGWAEASRQIAATGDDTLVLGDLPNADDAELKW